MFQKSQAVLRINSLNNDLSKSREQLNHSDYQALVVRTINEYKQLFSSLTRDNSFGLEYPGRIRSAQFDLCKNNLSGLNEFLDDEKTILNFLNEPYAKSQLFRSAQGNIKNLLERDTEEPLPVPAPFPSPRF